MACTVAQRTREVGIRIALGAARGNVIWMVMREVIRLVAIGVVAGVIASLALTRVVQSQLFGLTPQAARLWRMPPELLRQFGLVSCLPFRAWHAAPAMARRAVGTSRSRWSRPALVANSLTRG